MEDLEVMHLDAWKSEFTEDECNFDKVEEYLEFIKVAVDRYDPNRYSERHHIMPRCVDKEKKYDKEKVRVNGADHFEAHKRLIECFNGKLKCKMSFTLTKLLGHLGSYISPEDYEYARKVNSEALIGNKCAEGMVHTEESRKKMSEHHRLTDTEETKRKRSEALLGHRVEDETIEKIRNTLKEYYAKNREETGKSLPEETCSKISNSLLKYNQEHPEQGQEHSIRMKNYYKEHTVPLEIREKLSKAVKGEKNGMYGKHHTEESRKKMSESRKGNQNAKGNIWITDGINNKIIRDLADIPEGWRRGMTVKKSV